MFTYVHLRYRSYFFGAIIELYAKEGKCLHMYICVTVAIFFGAIIELYAKEGKCMHMNICVTVAQNFW
jgi:uncharacterized Fe-S cluster protein YjdI